MRLFMCLDLDCLAGRGFYLYLGFDMIHLHHGTSTGRRFINDHGITWVLMLRGLLKYIGSPKIFPLRITDNEGSNVHWNYDELGGK